MVRHYHIASVDRSVNKSRVESGGQGSLVHCSPWAPESHMT